MDARIGRTEQGEGDLGQRMQCAFARALASHDAALLMGTDCPALTHDILSQAAGQLQHHDAAMIPVHDGGYVMLGLKRPLPNVFDAMPWSTPRVAELTLQRLSQANASIWIGEPLHDIDEPQDLAHLPNDWHNLLKD
jgi:rSAM/selenodomain-associated transferase 1